MHQFLRKLGSSFSLLALMNSVFSAHAAETPSYLSEAMPVAEDMAEQRYRNSVALHSKLLCSGIFVSKRRAEDVIEQDLKRQWNYHDWSNTQWRVDVERQRVIVWAPPTADHRATPHYVSVHTPSLGCALLPPGAERTAFEPVDAGTRLPPANQMNWPMGDRHAATNTADRRKIEDALDFAFDDSKRDVPSNTRALLMVHHGKIVAERYAARFSAEMPLPGWSMGKSLVAVLLGVLAKQSNGLDLDAPVTFEEWQAPDPRSRITPRHLLNMAGGLRLYNPADGDAAFFSDLHGHLSVYFRGQNTERFALSQPLQYEPGKVFQYRNTNPLALVSLIKRFNEGAGQNHLTWPRAALLDRIGARSFVLETDAFGNFVMSGFDYATARDWARVGLLVLHDGDWEGKHLWPDGWRSIMTEPSPAAPTYGGLVWLMGSSKDLPPDSFAFEGWGGQIVLVVPSRDVVMVRLGLSEGDSFRPLLAEIVRRMLEALPAFAPPT